MKLSHKERRALIELAKPKGQCDYSRIHGHTIHALERKKLYGFEGESRRKRVTAAGRAELAVPNIFADLFEKKASTMNRTRFRSLDCMARDPRVVEIWDEGFDGIWAQLAPGYNFDGASCLHE